MLFADFCDLCADERLGARQCTSLHFQILDPEGRVVAQVWPTTDRWAPADDKPGTKARKGTPQDAIHATAVKFTKTTRLPGRPTAALASGAPADDRELLDRFAIAALVAIGGLDRFYAEPRKLADEAYCIAHNMMAARSRQR